MHRNNARKQNSCEGDMQVKASVVYQYKGALWKETIDTIWGILTFNLV